MSFGKYIICACILLMLVSVIYADNTPSVVLENTQSDTLINDLFIFASFVAIVIAIVIIIKLLSAMGGEE